MEVGGCLRRSQIGKGAVFCHNSTHRPGYVSGTVIYGRQKRRDRKLKLRSTIKARESNPLSVVPGTMAPWLDFDAIFSFNKNVVYDGKVIEQIISNRRALENQLFADRLLGLLGVKAGKPAL